MTFVFPLLLGGLVLTGIPVLIHLIMQQKPKHLLFPAMRFLMQKVRTNQRQLRLRHLLLLLLRMLLIAVLCLALARPKIFNERLNFATGQPVAVALVFDTSMSMEYAVGGKTRLAEAQRRAMELLEDLPENSKVAVFDTAAPGGGEWLASLTIARERINKLELQAANGPVTDSLPGAYQLLKALDEDPEQQRGEPMPRFLYVFSDRTQECWDASRVPQLQDLRKAIAGALPSVFVDVGVDKPENLAIVKVDLPRQVIPANGRVILRATVQATGKDYPDSEIVCRIDGEKEAERKAVKVKAGQPEMITFERRGIPEGLHQAEITVAAGDNLPFANARFATFEVRSARKVLVLTDDPGDESKSDDPMTWKRAGDAAIWKLAVDKFGAFRCEVLSTLQGEKLGLDELAKYQAICLLDVADPRPLWERLVKYVTAGGSLAIIPGGEELNKNAYSTDEHAKQLLPAEFVKIVSVEKGPGTPWAESTFRHPVMAPFRDWGMASNVDFIRFPPRAIRYWEVKPLDRASVIVSYADQLPALVERTFDRSKVRGRVVQFTTRLDGRAIAANSDRQWNDYLQSSFYLVLANQIIGYLAGDAEEGAFNSLCGQQVTVALPASSRFPNYTLQGPGISGQTANVPRTENQGELRITQAVMAGNYTLLGLDGKAQAGFSLNVPPGECQLGKVPVEQIETLFGPGAVLPVEQKISLREALQSHWKQPVELLPWLMMALLLVLALENLLANRFYRREPQADEGEPRSTKNHETHETHEKKRET